MVEDAVSIQVTAERRLARVEFSWMLMSEWWCLRLFLQSVQGFCKYGLTKSIRKFMNVASLGNEIHVFRNNANSEKQEHQLDHALRIVSEVGSYSVIDEPVDYAYYFCRLGKGFFP